MDDKILQKDHKTVIGKIIYLSEKKIARAKNEVGIFHY
ncbi:MAG: hypothetical protein Ct9H300mP6_18000 [Gammaproteobacteria bacterium]|nr:MAG: hypothetical protein Ct9H300mP6_18000 [Gammaproteobacteria bacterium]